MSLCVDSSLALELVKILKEFAVKRGKTIIMVIHQPSSQVFEMFDKLLLMADGKMVYFGDRANVVPYFAGVGYKCRENFNPADYIRKYSPPLPSSSFPSFSLFSAIVDIVILTVFVMGLSQWNY